MASPSSSTSLLFCFCILLTNSEGLEIAHNVTAFVGQPAKFTCTKLPNAEYPVDWHHRPVGSDTRIHIYSQAGGGFRPGYKEAFDAINNNAEGTYHLIIRNVLTSIAGTYYCVDNDEYSTTAAADLVVIDESPSCRASPTVALGNNDCGLVPDEIQLTCDVRYYGAIPPELKWLDMNGTDMDDGHKSSPIMLGPGKLRLNVSLSANNTLNGSHYVCWVAQQSGCTTEEIKIIERTSSVKRLVEILDSLKCTSAGAGSCRNFRWSNGTHEINKEAIGFNETKYQVHTCIADCELIDSRVGKCTLYEAQYKQGQEGFQHWTITLIITISVIVLLVLILAIFCLKRYKKSQENNRNGNQRGANQPIIDSARESEQVEQADVRSPGKEEFERLRTLFRDKQDGITN